MIKGPGVCSERPELAPEAPPKQAYPAGVHEAQPIAQLQSAYPRLAVPPMLISTRQTLLSTGLRSQVSTAAGDKCNVRAKGANVLGGGDSYFVAMSYAFLEDMICQGASVIESYIKEYLRH